MGTLRVTKLRDIITWAQIFQFQAEGGPCLLPFINTSPSSRD